MNDKFVVVGTTAAKRLPSPIRHYLRRKKLRRSLKARKRIVGFEGMTGIDGLSGSFTQCRNWNQFVKRFHPYLQTKQYQVRSHTDSRQL